MGFKTFASGDVLTAADVNDYLMEQVIIVCTSTTRPSSPNSGMVIYETDTKIFRFYEDGGWRHFLTGRTWESRTPVLVNLTTPKFNVQRYHVAGRLCSVSGSLVIDTATSISGTITIDLPFNGASPTGFQAWAGTVHYLDTGTRHYVGTCWVSPGGNTLNLVHPGSGNAGLVNATNPFTFADGDSINYAVSYEVG